MQVNLFQSLPASPGCFRIGHPSVGHNLPEVLARPIEMRSVACHAVRTEYFHPNRKLLTIGQFLDIERSLGQKCRPILLIRRHYRQQIFGAVSEADSISHHVANRSLPMAVMSRSAVSWPGCYHGVGDARACCIAGTRPDSLALDIGRVRCQVPVRAPGIVPRPLLDILKLRDIPHDWRPR